MIESVCFGLPQCTCTCVNFDTCLFPRTLSGSSCVNSDTWLFPRTLSGSGCVNSDTWLFPRTLSGLAGGVPEVATNQPLPPVRSGSDWTWSTLLWREGCQKWSTNQPLPPVRSGCDWTWTTLLRQEGCQKWCTNQPLPPFGTWSGLLHEDQRRSHTACALSVAPGPTPRSVTTWVQSTNSPRRLGPGTSLETESSPLHNR